VASQFIRIAFNPIKNVENYWQTFFISVGIHEKQKKKILKGS
jgi:hypothetical protein